MQLPCAAHPELALAARIWTRTGMLPDHQVVILASVNM